MKPLFAIVRRELSAFFSSPIGYVFLVVFLVLSGFFTFMVSSFIERGEADLGLFFMWMPWLYLFLVPAAGMRMWSEERRQHTFELLMTLPIAPWQAIVGKFMAAWVVIAVAQLLTFPVVLTVNYLGDPDNGVILAGMLGSLLLAGAYLAVVALTSSLTRNQVVSFILAAAVGLFLVLAGWPPVTSFLERFSPAWLVDVVAGMSVMTHFQSIQRGVLDSRDLLYFFSLIIFGLVATGVILRLRRSA
ncbi:MAG: ABC transporter permease [Terrimicrobiaceae bacterium]